MKLSTKMKNKNIIKLINVWLKENTQGFKKGFDKTILIFSYNDIKYDLINFIEENINIDERRLKN